MTTMRRNTGPRPEARALLFGVLLAFAALCAPSAFSAPNPSPAPAQSKDNEKAAALYQIFRDNFRGGPAEQKAAYEAGKKFLKKYGKKKDPEIVAVADYLRKWTGRYEAAAAEYERRKKTAAMGVGPGLPPGGQGGTGYGPAPKNEGVGDGTRPADKPPGDAPAAGKPKPRR